MNDYYLIRASDNPRFAEVHGPIDEAGKYLANYRNESGKALTDFRKLPPHIVKGTCRCVDKRKSLADCLRCVGRLVISERAAEIIQSFNVQEGTLLLPVDVVAKDGSFLGAYKAIMFNGLMDVIDKEASKYKKLTEEVPWYFTEPPVVRDADIRGLDLMFGSWVLELCSGSLRREIEKEGLTNFRFEETRTI